MKHIRKIMGIALLTVLLALCALLIYALLCMNQTEELQSVGANATQRPYVQPLALTGTVREDVSRYFPYPSAVLEGMNLEEQSARDEWVEGQRCRVITRVYTDAGGARYTLSSATPAAYMTAYAGYTAQGGVDMGQEGGSALLLVQGDRRCLLLRNGETVYALEGVSDEAALLTAGAMLAYE